jgi:hypothetical protein
MIPTIHWTYYKPKMTKGSIRCYICRGKPNILATTLLRISWNTSTILRLSRCLRHIKYYLINRINCIVSDCDILGKQGIFVRNDSILNMSPLSKLVLITALTSYVNLLNASVRKLEQTIYFPK